MRRRPPSLRSTGVASVALLVLVAGCTATDPPGEPRGPASTDTSTASAPATKTTSPVPPRRPGRRRVSPDVVRPQIAVAAVEHLAGRVGPRPGTSPAYFRAADWVQGQLEAHGWEVSRQRFQTPGGVSWGVPVVAGPSVNVIATRGELRAGEPWLIVGAHLDTVPQAPGAEDNASGIGALLAVAEAVDGRRTRLPVVLIAFGSEEPRGPTDDDHHYGSRAYVASLSPAQRRSLRGMVSLDRVGVGTVLPVGSASGEDSLSNQVRAAARRAGVPTRLDPFQRSSDHWSFTRDGLPGVRLGGTPYAAYHSAADVPSVVDPAQLERTARTVISWLR